MIPIPKRSTTVILLRETKKGFEVFLLKRHEKSSFMGGSFVYPGGIIDPHDSQPETYARCNGITPEEACRILGKPVPPEEGLSYWIAAIRELFEEAGVLLAYDEKGEPFASKDPSERDRFMGYRHALQEGTLSILQVAKEEKLFLAADLLFYYARWITPEAFPQRFDTRFFLARHIAAQEASPDERETTRGIWMSPREAIEDNLRSGEIILSPPTLKTLEDLSRFTRLDDLFNSFRNKVIETVLPILKRVSNQTFIVYPWDPEYRIFQQGEIPAPLDHGRPSLPGENSTRLLMRDGRWHLYRRDEQKS